MVSKMGLELRTVFFVCPSRFYKVTLVITPTVSSPRQLPSAPDTWPDTTARHNGPWSRPSRRTLFFGSRLDGRHDGTPCHTTRLIGRRDGRQDGFHTTRHDGPS